MLPWKKEVEPAVSLETRRSTAAGDVVGATADNGAHVWRGIRFAASTAGENRWRAPRPAASFDGVRPAIEHAPRCAQLTNAMDRTDGLKPGLVVGSEDCLALDIYAPADAGDGELPVMVWIHGGGNVWGRSSKHDGSRLAQNERVIVVAVQYRVGPLGWFAHPALRADAHTPEEATACFATLDLIAALRWVRDNIAAFGGDPDNVTIFGVSAGGHNVVTLLASPLAKGLFHRAIVESGVFDSTPLAHAEGTEGNLLNPSNKISKALGANTAEALRQLSVERLIGAYTPGSGFLDVPRVIEDGVVLPAGPLRDAFRSTDTFNPVPIILGTNRDEMKLFYVGDERFTKKRLGMFPAARDQRGYDALTDYLTRVWRVRSVNEPAMMMHRAGHDDVYVYRFDWDDGGHLFLTDFHDLFGAAHALEVPFVFNSFHHWGRADKILFEKATLEDRERLSRIMGAFWASFARSGVPSCGNAPRWPAFSEGTSSALRLDTENDGGVTVFEDRDSLERVISDLKREQRIDRCLVVEEICKWMFGPPIAAELRVATDCR